MIILKQTPARKEHSKIEAILEDNIDLYGDFYFTHDNIRISIRDNIDVLYRCLRKGDIVIYNENEKGIAIITGYSDKAERKYVKILAKDEENVDDLLKIIQWNIRRDLYVKIKKNSKFLKCFQRNYYKFLGDRGNEVLLFKKYIKRPFTPARGETYDR